MTNTFPIMYDKDMDTVEATSVPARTDLVSISLTAEQWDAVLNRPYADPGLKFAAELAIANQVPGWESRALTSDNSCAWVPGREIWQEAFTKLRKGEALELSLGPYHLHTNDSDNLIVVDIDPELYPDGIDILTSRLIVELGATLPGYSTSWNGYGAETMTMQFETIHGAE